MDRLDIDKKRAMELGIRYVDNHWKSLTEDEIELSILSGGFSSTLYLVEDISSSTSTNPINKFLIRFYGGKLITENDPLKAGGGEMKEALVCYAMYLAGLGPKLYGSFDGGRVEEFMPSHVLRDADYEENPETILELARKIARFHSLELPISKERNQILDVCELLYQQRDLDEFGKLADHIGFSNRDKILYKEFDVKSEIEWLKEMEKVVNGRIVTISGDINNNNILILDKPDKFGERVMIIDYELTNRDFRGRDLGQIFYTKPIENIGGLFRVCCEYPDDNWRRLLVTEYLKETKSLNYFEWDENLDNVDHVLMEADFFMFHSIQMFLCFLLNQKSDSYFFQVPAEQARSVMVLLKYLIVTYNKRKTIFIENYGKQLNLS